MSPITQPVAMASSRSERKAQGLEAPVTKGPEYWRSLEHLAESPEVQQYIDEEFPSLAQAIAKTDRRQFMRLLGASFALAGITSAGCRRWPTEEVRPHTSRPEGFTPGVAEYYATAIELDGVSTGILAKSYDGRPIKIEGNPDHPFSLGAASAFAQASVLECYDPDRSRHVKWLGLPAPALRLEATATKTWQDFSAFAMPHFQSLKMSQGEGLALLVQPTASPTMKRLMGELQQTMPKAKVFEYQPLARDNEFAGCRGAYGQVLRCQYELQKADVILSFDADLLGSHPASLKLARDWAAGRRSVDQGRMNRLIVVEPTMSVTGSVADVRLPMKPSLIEKSVAYLAYRFDILSEKPGGLSKEETAVLEQAALDIHRAGPSGVIAIGASQSAAAHQLVYAINEKLGSVGNCISYTEEHLASEAGSIKSLSEQLQGNVIHTLVILGGNPVYDLPADATLDLTSTESRPLTSIHLSLHDNETSAVCSWHLPAAHFLESWGDGRAWDGTYTLQQPLILPLFDGKSAIELMAMMLGQPRPDGRKLVRGTFDELFSGASDRDWETALHAGVKKGSQFVAVSPQLRGGGFQPPMGKSRDTVAGSHSYEIRFVADSKTLDGRFANNAWLQELPEPLTKLTWDNAALISQTDAESLGVVTGDVIRIANQDTQIEIAAYIMPGQAIGCITLPLGYGRTRAGHIGNGVGVDVYPIRTSDSSYTATDCEVTKTGQQYQLVSTQVHHLLDAVGEAALQKRIGPKGKPGMIVHEALLADFQRDRHAVHGDAHAVHEAPLYDLPHGFDSPHKWGMAIDLNACIGCSGCVVACQAENNIPVVGKANVAVNREMHWLRIDRYFKGDAQQPEVVHLPMACAHCENAPCEQVCPVAATVHDSEGLNSMIYNRCIGTRYCANNCPFKTRRFNYFDYQASDPRTPAKPWLQIPDQQQVVEISPLKKMVHNPEVTVRMRGVMEKCTFCVQRIVDARIHAKNDNAQGMRDSDLVADGEVKTACQATCPTEAIVFGDLNDPQSEVSKAKENVRNYEILEELNLGARTTYLAKVRNRPVTGASSPSFSERTAAGSHSHGETP
ncbi:Tetrathionate reductase subunit B precursor [Novipirellula aureliae]|uniref:Tetrathionate reductase subunit B n=1 Tax=Novipirellula aureliae TaxID=2527966 RepID=A0A5C6EF26_9BACT|nr:TAT-variant-translocated molybdopterin oxidoreductase [Novipirellula aureliae]TWU45819.1 Tetrathionate reductase subunit B precursor [Novipirellula aureliae]